MPLSAATPAVLSVVTWDRSIQSCVVIPRWLVVRVERVASAVICATRAKLVMWLLSEFRPSLVVGFNSALLLLTPHLLQGVLILELLL